MFFISVAVSATDMLFVVPGGWPYPSAGVSDKIPVTMIHEHTNLCNTGIDVNCGFITDGVKLIKNE